VSSARNRRGSAATTRPGDSWPACAPAAMSALLTIAPPILPVSLSMLLCWFYKLQRGLLALLCFIHRIGPFLFSSTSLPFFRSLKKLFIASGIVQIFRGTTVFFIYIPRVREYSMETWLAWACQFDRVGCHVFSGPGPRSLFFLWTSVLLASFIFFLWASILLVGCHIFFWAGTTASWIFTILQFLVGKNLNYSPKL